MCIAPSCRSVCKRMDKGVPTQAAILWWFEQGRNVPAGRAIRPSSWGSPAVRRAIAQLPVVPGKIEERVGATLV